MNLENVFFTLSIILFLIKIGKLIHQNRQAIKSHAVLFNRWAHSPITITTSSGMVAYLRATPASVMDTLMTFHSRLTHALLMLLTFLVTLGVYLQEQNIYKTFAAFITFYIISEITIACFRNWKK
jgi:hypothetical protein